MTTALAIGTDLDHITFTRSAVRTATNIAADLGWLHDEFAAEGITVSSSQDRVDVARQGHRSRPGVDFREGGNVPALWARAARRPG